MAKLDLPFEYQKRPEWFDALNVCDNAQNDLIESLLHKHRVKSVLDLSCGTGSQVFHLAKRGYEVVGADFSPAPLSMARRRAKREKADVRFIGGDMRTLKAGKFDAVITIANAIGHLTKNEFERTVKNVARNLKDGGVYLFDILNLEAMTVEVVAGLAIHTQKKLKHSWLHRIQCSTVDKKKGHLICYETGFIQDKAGKPERFNYKSALQIYTPKQLRKLLEKNGFDIICQCGRDGSKFDGKKSIDMLTLARKR
jgi:ubiquinone/menaquinone biosynthesis C-methylase UbiE